jgi:hypothetical protein
VGATVANLIRFLVLSLIVWVVSGLVRKGKKRLSYGQVYKIALHSVVWVVLLELLSNVPALTYVRDWVNAVVMVWMVIAMVKLPKGVGTT